MTGRISIASTLPRADIDETGPYVRCAPRPETDIRIGAGGRGQPTAAASGDGSGPGFRLGLGFTVRFANDAYAILGIETASAQNG